MKEKTKDDQGLSEKDVATLLKNLAKAASKDDHKIFVYSFLPIGKKELVWSSGEAFKGIGSKFAGTPVKETRSKKGNFQSEISERIELRKAKAKLISEYSKKNKRWAVRLESNSKPYYKTFSSKEEAIIQAEKLKKRGKGAMVVIAK